VLRQIRSMGLYGVKFHPDFQGCFIDDPHMIEILQEAASLGLVIVLHAGMDPSFPLVHHCTPERIARVMKQLPGARVVAAHCGGYGYLDDAERYLVGTGIYLDTSLLGRYPQAQVLRILKNHDPDRLLFASDTPWDDQKAALERFCALPLAPELQRKILSENAVRLLGLENG
ncbi:MAG: amidohydrolase family protein, partial [Firmicutes bacterium]|nr:amidohydrolase family protein [Bacillota bacterium]